jgi:Ca2+-binding RTX toxin-like protein
MPIDTDWQIIPNGTFDFFINPVVNIDSELNFFAGEDDLAYGGTGDDFIATQLGNDIAFGEDGQDTLVGGSHNDVLFGGAGNDFLSGDYHDYAYEPPNGVGVQGDDILDGGAGNDWLQGEGGNDTVLGGSGVDVLRGDADYLLGTDHGRDHLEGGAGDDILYGQGSDDVLFGGDGIDTILGDDIESVLGSSYHGDDVIYGDAGDDLIAGTGGNDEIHGGVGDDYIHGDQAVAGLTVAAHGDDRVYGEAGNDTLFGNGGNDYLAGGDGQDYLDGDAGDVAAAYHGDDELNGGAGNDSLYGRGGQDTMLGGSGDDYLAGGNNSDFLDGGYGRDYLRGDAGDDVLLGSAGYDVLDGGSGNNRYELHFGDDEEFLVVSDSVNPTSQGTHDIYLPVGVTAGQLQVSQSGSHGTDLVIRYGDGDVLTLSGVISFDVESGYFTASTGNAEDVKLHLSDTNYLSVDNLLALAETNISVTDYDDTLIGSTVSDSLGSSFGDDVIYGMDGDDTLSGAVGRDEIYGGNGNDYLRGGADDDVLYGGNGDDTIEGLSGADVIYGGSGNDDLYAQGEHQLGPGDGDILYGGDGDDSLYNNQWGFSELAGEAGNDTYYLDFSLGHSAEINNYDASDLDSYDVVSFNDWTARDLSFTQQDDDLRVGIIDYPTTHFIVKNWFLGSEYQIDQLDLAKNKSLTAADINAIFDESSGGGKGGGNGGGKGKNKTVAVTDIGTTQTEVDNLIAAMASFDAQPSAQSYYPPDTRFMEQAMLIGVGEAGRTV